jgi:hypothetical protein
VQGPGFYPQHHRKQSSTSRDSDAVSLGWDGEFALKMFPGGVDASGPGVEVKIRKPS